MRAAVETERAAGRSYQDLVVWQKAMDLIVATYAATRDFPTAETYGLTNQLRRAAVSVPANIAEGQGRASPREFAHHLSIALGSLCEVETHLLIAQRLTYLEAAAVEPLLTQATEVGRLLHGLTRSLNRQHQQ